MIQKITMYTCVCDNCKKSADEGSEWSCWGDESTASEMAMEANFIEHEGKDYCSDCWYYDDNDNILIDEKRFKN